MATQRIGSNRITDGEVTGSKLGVNSIGANNFSSAANTYISSAAASSPSVTAAFNTANAAFAAANNSLAVDVTQNNSVASAFVHANAAFGASNTATLLNDGVNTTQNNSITAAFAAANAATATDVTQNNSIASAFVHANAAFANANTYITYNEGVNLFQNADTLYANTTAIYAFIRANNSLDANNGGTISGAVNYAGVNASLTMNAPLTVRSNLNIQTVTETANIYSTAVFGNVILALANNTTYYFATPPTANVTFDLRANNQSGGHLDGFMVTGQMISVGVLLPQGATAYRANVYVDGVLQTANVRWAGNVNPLGGGTANGIDVYNFSVLKRGANSYIILASNTVFANGASA
jgi:hypothetical protein